jgi:hypothetical protein
VDFNVLLEAINEILGKDIKMLKKCDQCAKTKAFERVGQKLGGSPHS